MKFSHDVRTNTLQDLSLDRVTGIQIGYVIDQIFLIVLPSRLSIKKKSCYHASPALCQIACTKFK